MNKKEISPKGATELLQLAVHQLLDAHNYYYNNNWNSIGITSKTNSYILNHLI